MEHVAHTPPVISIQNVVATASIGKKIDLDLIRNTFAEVEYNPDQFPGLIFRIKSPRTATLIFTTGKMVCAGAKSEEESIRAIKKVAQKLRNGKIKIGNNLTITIQNIVASVDLIGKIHLEDAARRLPRSMYEPEQFPGLIYRMLEPKTVTLVFASGKLVCTGARKEPDVYRSVHNLQMLLEEKNLISY